MLPLFISLVACSGTPATDDTATDTADADTDTDTDTDADTATLPPAASSPRVS